MNTIARLFLFSLCLGLTASLGAAESTPAAKTAPAAPAVPATPAAAPASVQGKWTAEFDSPVGTQNYAYEFKVEGGKLTGTAEGSMFGGKTEITEGKVTGNTIIFTENVDAGGMAITITYTGEIKGDEIAFKRVVGDFGTEELVAKRVKPEAPAAAAPAKKD